MLNRSYPQSLAWQEPGIPVSEIQLCMQGSSYERSRRRRSFSRAMLARKCRFLLVHPDHPRTSPKLPHVLLFREPGFCVQCWQFGLAD